MNAVALPYRQTLNILSQVTSTAQTKNSTEFFKEEKIVQILLLYSGLQRSQSTINNFSSHSDSDSTNITCSGITTE